MAPHDVGLPRNLVAAAKQEGREDWLVTVPGTFTHFAQEWSLTIGPPFQPGGHTAWVAPARTSGGEPRVLKVAWRHPEADHEGHGLQIWAGAGTVRLYRMAEFPATTVLLLERCDPGHPLSRLPEHDQDLVIAALLRRLWIPADAEHPFRPLSEMCGRWADQFDQKLDAGLVRLDPALAADGIAVFRSLATTAEQHVLLCTDLHAGNVLAAQREPWLAIDPKPYVGDPTYDVLQHLLNCPGRLHNDPYGLIVRMADLLDLDREWLQLWVFARCVQESAEWPKLADVARQLAPT